MATRITIIDSALRPITRAAAEARLAAADVPFGSRNTVADLLVYPQLEERSRWADVPPPGAPVRTVIPPFNIGGVTTPMGAVPRLDEHGTEIRKELGR